MLKHQQHEQIPKTKSAKAQMDEILRHYSDDGSRNFKMIKIDEVVIPENLSKKHPKKQIKKLVRAIIKLGYANPIIITEDNVLISGYGRILAAQELGMTEIPAVVLSNVSKTDAAALRLLDNRLAEDSEWDLSILKAEIDKILNCDFELEEIGFDPIDYDKLLQFSNEETMPDTKREEDACLNLNFLQKQWLMMLLKMKKVLPEKLSQS